MFAQHHITVVQHFSTNPARVSATVPLATMAAFRAAIPLLRRACIDRIVAFERRNRIAVPLPG